MFIVKVYDVMSLFVSSRRRHTSLQGDWSSDVCSSDLLLSRARRSGQPLADERHVPAAERGAGEEVREGSNRSGARQIGRASCRDRVEVRNEGEVEEERKGTGRKSRIIARIDEE